MSQAENGNWRQERKQQKAVKSEEKKHIYGLQMRNVTQLWLFLIVITWKHRKRRTKKKTCTETTFKRKVWEKRKRLYKVDWDMLVDALNKNHGKRNRIRKGWRGSISFQPTFCRSKPLIYGTRCPYCCPIDSPIEEKHDEHWNILRSMKEWMGQRRRSKYNHFMFLTKLPSAL